MSSSAGPASHPASPLAPSDAPRQPAASPSPAAFASPDFRADAEAVAMDPAALWAALDLPAPESLPSQHTARRVVLLGRPLSGKRTLCRRLCYAAEAQYAMGSDESSSGAAGGHGGGGAVDNGRQPLYNPTASDDEGDDAALFPEQRVGGWNMPGAFSTVGALPQDRASGQPPTHADAMAHGSGVCFDYVVQRVPMRHTRAADASAMASATRRTAPTAAPSPPPPPSTAAPLPSSLHSGGTVRRTTEFFCCDTAGALSMALSTLDEVQSAVVLVVVDVSDISSIHQQLEYAYSTLNTHVASVLRRQAPTSDEVRRLQLAAAQQDYWAAEEQKMRATRAALAASSSSAKEGTTDVVFKDPAANLERVNATPFRVPSSANTVSTMHTIIVCTKSEALESASRTIGTLDGTAASGSSGGSDALLSRLGVSAELAAALRRSRLSLVALVSQMLRHYAIYHRAALAAVGQRTNMTTAGAGGDYAGSTLVNPFFKGLWSYIAYVLYDGAVDANAALPDDVLRVCSARMHPHALLPCGLDAPGLLNHFITSEQVQMADVLTPAAARTPGAAAGAAVEGSIRTTVFSVETPDGTFPLHQGYLHGARSDASGMWGQAEATAQLPEEPAMVWDTM